jgi:hypothetical protein
LTTLLTTHAWEYLAKITKPGPFQPISV